MKGRKAPVQIQAGAEEDAGGAGGTDLGQRRVKRWAGISGENPATPALRLGAATDCLQ